MSKLGYRRVRVAVSPSPAGPEPFRSLSRRTSTRLDFLGRDT
jgi:hypothetical protein